MKKNAVSLSKKKDGARRTGFLMPVFMLNKEEAIIVRAHHGVKLTNR